MNTDLIEHQWEQQAAKQRGAALRIAILDDFADFFPKITGALGVGGHLTMVVALSRAERLKRWLRAPWRWPPVRETRTFTITAYILSDEILKRPEHPWKFWFVETLGM